MLFWIFAGIIVYAAIIFLPSLFLLTQIGAMGYARGRDEEPLANAYHGRALRASRNMSESMPVFLALGVLAVSLDGVDMAGAVLGAQVFVISRAFYAPAYMSGIAMLRSTVWTIGLVGLILMAIALA